MRHFVFRYILLFFYFTLLGVGYTFAQSVPQGFNYQTTVRNNSGSILTAQAISLRFSLYSNSPTGTLVWQEKHALITDAYGHVKTIIGNGISTGGGSLSAFNQINWLSGIYYLKVSIDALGGTTYVDMGTAQLFSVPYAFYSLKTKTTNSLSLVELQDVDVTTNAVGYLLKWNGMYWIPSLDNDSDTVLYAYNSTNAVTSDSASYVYGTIVSDTTMFAYNSDSSVYSTSSLNAVNSNSSTYSDTAMYVLSSPPTAWIQTGNTVGSSSNYIGTNDGLDVVFKTNNVMAASIKSNGHLSIGATSNNANLSIVQNDGILETGTIGSSFIPVAGAGTKMLWYPSLGICRAGYIDGNQWDTVNLGTYSMAVGYNNKTRNWSFASGSSNEVIDCSIGLGRKNQALGLGVYPEGGCVAIGDSNVATFRRSVALGKNNIASNSASVAIGYDNLASGNTCTTIGSFCTASGTRSVAVGFHASALHTGAFVFADASSSATVSSTVNHQFKVRASGGVVFYTDSLNTMGVTLNPGSGSWAVISDKNKKENFSSLDYESVLRNINQLKIKSWNYKSQANSIRHIGPMAQDFYALFGVGENNITISTGDMDGVILSGIKGLNNRINKLDNLNDVDLLKNKAEQLDDSEELNKRLDAIEAAINKN